MIVETDASETSLIEGDDWIVCVKSLTFSMKLSFVYTAIQLA